MTGSDPCLDVSGIGRAVIKQQRLLDGTLWRSLGGLYLFQLSEIHTQAFFTVFTLELNFDELGVLFHLTFKDDPFAELIVANPFTWLILLALRFGWCRRCSIAIVLL